MRVFLACILQVGSLRAPFGHDFQQLVQVPVIAQIARKRGVPFLREGSCGAKDIAGIMRMCVACADRMNLQLWLCEAGMHKEMS